MINRSIDRMISSVNAVLFRTMIHRRDGLVKDGRLYHNMIQLRFIIV